jgi:hypothetical protein
VITQSSLFVSFVYKFIIWERNPKKTKKQKPEKKNKKEKEVAPTIHLTPVKTNTVKLSLLFYCSKCKD